MYGENSNLSHVGRGYNTLTIMFKLTTFRRVEMQYVMYINCKGLILILVSNGLGRN